jgi:hypothetical protein
VQPIGRHEQLLAVVEGLHQAQARDFRCAEQPPQPLPALDQRQRPKVLPIAVQEIKGIDDGLVLPPAPSGRMQLAEVRRAAGAGEAELGVNYCRAAWDGLERLYQDWQALCPVVSIPAVEAYLAILLDDLQAIPVELGLMQPAIAGGHGLGPGRAAGVNELRGRRGHAKYSD